MILQQVSSYYKKQNIDTDKLMKELRDGKDTFFSTEKCIKTLIDDLPPKEVDLLANFLLLSLLASLKYEINLWIRFFLIIAVSHDGIASSCVLFPFSIA